MTEGGPAAVRYRLFFALWPDDGLAAALADLAATAAQRFGGRPTRRETLHLTLAFLGDVAAAELDGLLVAARRVQTDPFLLTVDRLGCWAHNRLLWAGCRPSPGLERLHRALRAELAAAGHARRSGAFTPHLTLLRKLPDTVDPPALAGVFPEALPPWSCTSFRLVASRLSAAGSDYTCLAEFPLSA